MVFKPRPAQQEILNYRGGKMGVSAVPGSGKTHTLSYLASQLITTGQINEDQEVLIVTLVNSAVENFSSRIEGFITQAGFLPGLNYRVRTLHGLAHDIIRERPDLAGLSNDFRILDGRDTENIITGIAHTWYKSNPEFILDLTDPSVDLQQNRFAVKGWETLIEEIATAFIRQSKDLRISPDEIRTRLDSLHERIDLLEMGWQLYHDYQQALNYRAAVDFDDLLQLALRCLHSDPEYLDRLRYRWPFILEDEAQDSSKLQEDILRLLSGSHGNWIRVGDPNQAIYETFTTASPDHLKNFMKEPDVTEKDLPTSGRSTQSIIDLANELILWTINDHPIEGVRKALTTPLIDPTLPNDPQRNPADRPEGVILYNEKLTPEKESEYVARSVAKWLPAHGDETVAVLVPRNERGAKVVEELKRREVPYLELLQSSEPTRSAAGILADILTALSDPVRPASVSDAYRQLKKQSGETDPPPDQNLIRLTADALQKCRHIEDFIWPVALHDWLDELRLNHVDQGIIDELIWLREYLQRWQNAVVLPIDQLILTISQDIFTSPVDLALAHKLALLLKQVSEANPDFQLPEFAAELKAINANRRKLTGFSEEDSAFDPDRHKGKVVVSTIHKAKGLEWDRVYLLSVNNYDFPSGEPEDTYMSEKWFVRDHHNLQAEILAKLNFLIKNDIPAVYEEFGAATRESRLTYASERLRLLYVGITRARKELVMLWNTGKRSNSILTQALPFEHLSQFQREKSHENT